jgi:peptide/nickel transport system permease protein
VLKFGARRLTELVLVMFIVSFVSFLVATFLPGNPAVTLLGPHHTPAQYAAVDHQLGLDRPLLTRFWLWLTAALHGDLGRSLLPPRASVSSMVHAALPVSAELCILAFVFSFIIAIPVALWSAARPNGLADRGVTATSFALLSMPEFLAGLLLILLFVVAAHKLPRLGWVGLSSGPVANLRHALLPALALSLPYAALYAQILRNDLLATLQEDYILAASATGETPNRILIQGALRPSLFSLVTVAGVGIGYLIGGTAIVETLFGLPGLGNLLVRSAGGSDVPVLQAVVLVLALSFVVVNAALDILYAYLDPRIRRGTI